MEALGRWVWFKADEAGELAMCSYRWREQAGFIVSQAHPRVTFKASLVQPRGD